jgi:azurin
MHLRVAYRRVVAMVRTSMKFHPTLLVATAAFSLTLGCSKQESAPAAAAAKPAAAAPTAPAATPAAAARVITIEGNDAMKFNITRIEAKPGEALKIVFKNVGTLPKEAMGHNWVLLAKGTDVMAFSTAAMQARTTEYIPAALANQVIAHSKLLGPKQTDEISFTVPSEPGDYPYVCSFPAHAMAGMRGVLVVK